MPHLSGYCNQAQAIWICHHGSSVLMTLCRKSHAIRRNEHAFARRLTVDSPWHQFSVVLQKETLSKVYKAGLSTRSLQKYHPKQLSPQAHPSLLPASRMTNSLKKTSSFSTFASDINATGLMYNDTSNLISRSNTASHGGGQAAAFGIKPQFSSHTETLILGVKPRLMSATQLDMSVIDESTGEEVFKVHGKLASMHREVHITSSKDGAQLYTMKQKLKATNYSFNAVDVQSNSDAAVFSARAVGWWKRDAWDLRMSFDNAVDGNEKAALYLCTGIVSHPVSEMIMSHSLHACAPAGKRRLRDSLQRPRRRSHCPCIVVLGQEQ
jgi:hypothetical protein